MLARDLQFTPKPWDLLASAGKGPPAYSLAPGPPSLCWPGLQLTPKPWDLLASAGQGVTTVAKTYQEGQSLPNTDLLPLEQCTMYMENQKLSADISNPLCLECSKIQARNFLCSRQTTKQFDEVDWSSLNNALSSKTTGFRIWLAKQHSNFCASRVQMLEN